MKGYQAILGAIPLGGELECLAQDEDVAQPKYALSAFIKSEPVFCQSRCLCAAIPL
jgi:hypothetical protein